MSAGERVLSTTHARALTFAGVKAVLLIGSMAAHVIDPPIGDPGHPKKRPLGSLYGVAEVVVHIFLATAYASVAERHASAFVGLILAAFLLAGYRGAPNDRLPSSGGAAVRIWATAYLAWNVAFSHAFFSRDLGFSAGPAAMISVAHNAPAAVAAWRDGTLYAWRMARGPALLAAAGAVGAAEIL